MLFCKLSLYIDKIKALGSDKSISKKRICLLTDDTIGSIEKDISIDEDQKNKALTAFLILGLSF